MAPSGRSGNGICAVIAPILTSLPTIPKHESDYLIQRAWKRAPPTTRNHPQQPIRPRSQPFPLTTQTSRRQESWIQAANAGATELVVGRTVFPPGGSSHERHRHHSADEFVYVVRGAGVVMNGEDEIPVRAGQMAFHPKGIWHGFRNTSDIEETEVIWAWGGAGSREAAGYEVKPEA
ncbi:MAG: cupin domain-containing protein [Nitriliruptor sp.]|nr:MAG: cupin domain-containing protein [Nitriliruptor sp.]